MIEHKMNLTTGHFMRNGKALHGNKFLSKGESSRIHRGEFEKFNYIKYHDAFVKAGALDPISTSYFSRVIKILKEDFYKEIL